MGKQPKDVTSSEDDFGGYRGMRSDATLDGRARMNENPYKPFRSVRGTVDSAKRVTDERFGAWELGYNARCPEGWIVVRLDEHEALMRECEALRLERDEARRKLAIAIDVTHEFEDEKIALADRLAKWERGEWPSTEAQHGVLLDQIKELAAERDAALTALRDVGDRLAEVVARVCGEGHPALAAWRSVSGSSEPRKEKRMSGHLDGPPPGPPNPPYIPGDMGAPSAEEFARRRASSEPRPDLPPDPEHDCDEDGEIPCSICGYVSGMYDNDPPSEPRPENPNPYRPPFSLGTDEDLAAAFDEGFASRQPEIDRLRAMLGKVPQEQLARIISAVEAETRDHG